MDFHHKVSKGLSQLNKPHKNRSKSGGKVEVSKREHNCLPAGYLLTESHLSCLLICRRGISWVLLVVNAPMPWRTRANSRGSTISRCSASSGAKSS